MSNDGKQAGANKPGAIKVATYAYGSALILTISTFVIFLSPFLSRLSFAMPTGPEGPTARSVVASALLYISIAAIFAFAAFLVFGLPVLFLYQLNRKRQWGRIGLLIFTLWDAFDLVRGLTRTASANSGWWLRMIGPVSISLEVAAIVLLFLRSSNTWFRRSTS